MPRTNAPVGQHYNPVMLLRNFCDSDGLIWVSDGNKVYRTNPTNVFKIRHLYTRLDFTNASRGVGHQAFIDSVEKSYEHEDQLSELEARAAPAVRQIAERARNGNPPQLSVKLRNSLKRFIIAMARRTPESQARVAVSNDLDDVFYETSQRVAELNGQSLPPKEKLYQDPRFRELEEMVMANTNARFAAGAHPILERETQKFIRETGLSVAVIRTPPPSFIVGSHGLTIIDDPLEGGFPAGSWLPVAHDVAVGVTAFPDRDVLMVLDDTSNGDLIISGFNRATASRSRIIAGQSETLVRSLTQT